LGSGGEQAQVLPTATVVRLPSSDLDEAVQLWNQLASELSLPTIARLTDARRGNLRARMKEAGGIEGWRHALDEVRQSSFLCGTQARKDGSSWVWNFDFLMRPNSFARVMEGAFRDRARVEPAPLPLNPFDQLEQEMLARGAL